MTRIFLIDDDEMYSQIIRSTIESNDLFDVEVFYSGEEFLEKLSERPDICIIDYNLPGISGVDVLKHIKAYDPDIAAVLLSGQDRVEVVVEAYNNGANNYIIKNENVIPELQNALKNLAKQIGLKKELLELKSQIVDRNKYSRIIGESKATLNLLRLIQKVEKTDIITLVTGESGTGKELVAKALHYNSNRRRNAFVAVNVAAIPADLIESELFGHEKGAFTGAGSRRIGKFEEADKGTLFLDEIGEMAPDLQTKLLRVLQDSKITRLGSNKEIKLNIRIIAATNKNLFERVKEGKFREDLFYRLQGFLIHLSPLRERDNDVILLARHFLSEFCRENNMSQKTISKSSINSLLGYTWPGNVRELKSTIERAALLSENESIDPEDIIYAGNQ
ncbi:MAG: sigma-54-dependent Fis family transcriptional regulator [Cyclobacteriaceae bacterium]|nr:sigma-54-dependent Fis family transcriptional regulator [Cyclobacteriaceae bacterium]